MRRIALLIVAPVVVIVLLVVAQLVLPGIAEQSLHDRLARSGRVIKVEVDAFPAIELLWHQADRVVVRMATYTSTAHALSATVAQVADVGSLDASATEFRSGLLTLRDATLRKRGSVLSGSASVTEADLRAALPILDSVQPVSSSGGRLTLQGTATLLGVSATVDATVRPQNGALVVSPDVPLGGLATITLFSNPAVQVQSVAANPSPGGFAVSARAQVR
jgi:hypothetical protein